MTVADALGWTGAILVIPAIISWILFQSSWWTSKNNGVLSFGFKGWALVLAILFTVAVLGSWIAALWLGVKA